MGISLYTGCDATFNLNKQIVYIGSVLALHIIKFSQFIGLCSEDGEIILRTCVE
jgi:hypothetical protein